MSLAQSAQAVNGKMIGANVEFTSVTTDTRKASPGDLFVALVGPNFDGHEFIAQAKTAGAVAALVSHKVNTELPYVVVEDTRIGLGRLAAFWRAQFEHPLVAVTGSNGKTTVKEMIAAILRESGPVCVTRGNLNNDIGVPLTLLSIQPEHRYAVIEMGMNHLGEISYLSSLAKPDVAVITNAAEAHLEGLGSIEKVAQAKGEIFDGAPADAVAVLNADDAYYKYWKSRIGNKRYISFGLDNPADFSAEYESVEDGLNIFLKCSEGGIEMKLPLYGKHNVMNALAASAAAVAAGSSLADIKNGLEKLRSVAGRLEVKKGINGARVLDDTYNANPASVAAGLQVLRESKGECILVLGDMAELGDAAGGIHARVGELARRVGADRVFGYGPFSKEAVDHFGKGGKHFEDRQKLIDELRECMNPEVTVLVKGSRKMQMEQVVNQITVDDKAANESGN
ncbi:MAG: UDP-N-acetylmuramoyl-tripeptide--D-alanyl-D-alanine ligase [Acidiferrobacterales bacterium]